MNDFVLARVIHVIAVVLWIGGVAMVTLVIVPAIKAMSRPEEQLMAFEKIEGRFALQAKVTTLLAGLSGFYMMYKLNAWHRYLDASFWWLHAMTAVWLIFSIILYILEPLVFHKLLGVYAERNPSRTFGIIHVAHWLLLLLSLLTIGGAVAGSHGGL